MMPACAWPFVAGVVVGAVLMGWAWVRSVPPATPPSPPPRTGPHKGTVRSYDRNKGFGFITRDPLATDAFVHFSSIVDLTERETLQAGDRVEFFLLHGAKGPQAADVRKIHTDQRGFTLLEVMIALVLASMLAVAMGSMYAVMFRGMILSARMVQAQGIAERTLLTAHSQPCEWEGHHENTVQDEGKTFRRVVDVVATPAGSLWRLWRFDVVVSWQQWGRWYDAKLRVHEQADYTCPQWNAR